MFLVRETDDKQLSAISTNIQPKFLTFCKKYSNNKLILMTLSHLHVLTECQININIFPGFDVFGTRNDHII